MEFPGISRISKMRSNPESRSWARSTTHGFRVFESSLPLLILAFFGGVPSSETFPWVLVFFYHSSSLPTWILPSTNAYSIVLGFCFVFYFLDIHSPVDVSSSCWIPVCPPSPDGRPSPPSDLLPRPAPARPGGSPARLRLCLLLPCLALTLPPSAASCPFAPQLTVLCVPRTNLALNVSLPSHLHLVLLSNCPPPLGQLHPCWGGDGSARSSR